MSELHDLLVAEVARVQPAAPPSFEVLAARARRRRVLRSVAAVAVSAAVVVGSIVATLGALGGGDDRMSLTPAGPLITRGECAGLSVAVTLPGHRGRWPIQQGTQPRPVAMPPDALMWLRAQGPCIQRLRISASNNLIQTATGGVTTFNAQGIGIIVSNGKAGAATIDLVLAPAVGRSGPTSKIASVPVTITRDSTAITQSPSPSP